MIDGGANCPPSDQAGLPTSMVTKHKRGRPHNYVGIRAHRSHNWLTHRSVHLQHSVAYTEYAGGIPVSPVIGDTAPLILKRLSS